MLRSARATLTLEWAPICSFWGWWLLGFPSEGGGCLIFLLKVVVAWFSFWGWWLLDFPSEGGGCLICILRAPGCLICLLRVVVAWLPCEGGRLICVLRVVTCFSFRGWWLEEPLIPHPQNLVFSENSESATRWPSPYVIYTGPTNKNNAEAKPKFLPSRRF